MSRTTTTDAIFMAESTTSSPDTATTTLKKVKTAGRKGRGKGNNNAKAVLSVSEKSSSECIAGKPTKLAAKMKGVAKSLSAVNNSPQVKKRTRKMKLNEAEQQHGSVKLMVDVEVKDGVADGVAATGSRKRLRGNSESFNVSEDLFSDVGDDEDFSDDRLVSVCVSVDL